MENNCIRCGEVIPEGRQTCLECESKYEPKILDSGNRRKFESGAVRDVCEGKGRCDLLPLDIIGKWMNDPFIKNIAEFMETGNTQFLWENIGVFSFRDAVLYNLIPTARVANNLLEVAKQFEDGAKKYGDRNWQKGIPVHCYIDSAVRHYLKWLRGDKDEPHDRAFLWNQLCCIWTYEHKPELIDIGVQDDKTK